MSRLYRHLSLNSVASEGVTVFMYPSRPQTRPRLRRHLKRSRFVCSRLLEHNLILRPAKSLSFASKILDLHFTPTKRHLSPYNEDATCRYHLSQAPLDRCFVVWSHMHWSKSRPFFNHTFSMTLGFHGTSFYCNSMRTQSGRSGGWCILALSWDSWLMALGLGPSHKHWLLCTRQSGHDKNSPLGCWGTRWEESEVKGPRPQVRPPPVVGWATSFHTPATLVCRSVMTVGAWQAERTWALKQSTSFLCEGLLFNVVLLINTIRCGN